MQMRSKATIVLGSLAALALLFVFFGRSEEEQYQGRPLVYWISQGDFKYQRDAERAQAERAVRKIGTNAIPSLIKWVQNGPDALAFNAGQALEDVADMATPFIPELMAMLDDRASSTTAIIGTAVLSRVGTNALPALIDAIESPAFASHRGFVFSAIREMRPSPDVAAPAVPVLIRCLSETNIPHMAADTLGTLQAQPDLTVPALILSLHTTNIELREASLCALQPFLASTQTAVPTLTKCLENRNPQIAFPAANVLGRFGFRAATALPSLTNLLSIPEGFGPASNAIWLITRDVGANAPPK